MISMQDYLRYNEKKLQFLEQQMEPIVKLISTGHLSSFPPGDVPNEDWTCSWRTLQKTVELGKELIKRHKSEFNLKTFCSTNDAKRGIEWICGILKDIVDQWAPIDAELKGMQIQDNIPEAATDKDREDLHSKLDFVLNGGPCTFPPAFQREWDSVRMKHLEREKNLYIIKKDKIKITRKLTNDTWEGLYCDSFMVTVKMTIPGGESLKLEEVAKFYAEVSIMQSLNGPFVASLVGANTAGLLVVERGERNLMDWYRQRDPIGWPSKVKVLCEAAKGLEFVHDQGVIHGRVNSKSFLMFNGGSVKIADFSSAIQITNVKISSTWQPIRRPLWIAPEIFGGMSHSKATDVYGFGVVMYEVAAQRHPYGMGATDAEVWKKKKEGVPPCKIPGDCPASLRVLIEECCSLEYLRRPSMSEVAMRLKQLKEEIGAS